MAGILWPALYPKSGNTWLRIFIANLFAEPNKPLDINALGKFIHGEMSPELFRSGQRPARPALSFLPPGKALSAIRQAVVGNLYQ